MNQKIKTIIFTLVAWGLTLWLINFLCGFIVGNRYIAVDPVDAKSAQKSFGYFVPSQDKIILFPGLKEYRVRINALGLRNTGKSWTEDNIKDHYRILTLGDSMTFGLFVNDEDSFPYRLQKILDAAGKKTAVLNAGVGGGVQKDYLYYLKVKGLALKPDLVVISFCENDLNELGKPPLYERMKKDGAYSFEKRLKLANVLRVFRKWELAYRYQHWLKKIDDGKVRQILKTESKDLEDIFKVQEAEGGLAAVNPADPSFQKAWEENNQVLREIVELLREEKVEVVFLIYPNILNVFDRAQVNVQDIVGKYLREQGVLVVDPLPEFKARRSEFLTLYNNLPRDFHLSGTGSQIVAEKVYQSIANGVP